MNFFNNPHYDKHEQVLFGFDEKSGLRAIIAVHNTALGPALGGCRMHPYASDEEALADVLRLSRGMTYKSAMAELPLGGGKSVIIADPARQKTPELLRAMGRFVDSLHGRYMVAKDMGIGVEDLQIMAQSTRHISGVEQCVDEAGRARSGDPSPSTVYGVFCGIRASVRHRLGRDDLAGLRVAIQGLGSVGYGLARLLKEAGAQIYVSDINELNVARACRELDAVAVSPEEIVSQDVDVFSPCAMGAIINDQTVNTIRAKIVAGAANNQLAQSRHGEALHRRNILYAPDYVINAGGIIDAWYNHSGRSAQELKQHVENIANTLDQIYRESAESQQATHVVADGIAERRFRSGERLAS